MVSFVKKKKTSRHRENVLSKKKRRVYPERKHFSYSMAESICILLKYDPPRKERSLVSKHAFDAPTHRYVKGPCFALTVCHL